MSERVCPRCGETGDWGGEFAECETCDPIGATDDGSGPGHPTFAALQQVRDERDRLASQLATEERASAYMGEQYNEAVTRLGAAEASLQEARELITDVAFNLDNHEECGRCGRKLRACDRAGGCIGTDARAFLTRTAPKGEAAPTARRSCIWHRDCDDADRRGKAAGYDVISHEPQPGAASPVTTQTGPTCSTFPKCGCCCPQIHCKERAASGEAQPSEGTAKP